MSVHVGGRGPGHLVRSGGAFYPAATTALDFQLQKYRNGAGTYSVRDLSAVTGWTFTRASAKTAANSAGQIISFASGVPAITDLGLLLEEARTNSFLNSATGVTQSVTTTAASWTLSFYGTGSITLSGGATGTLAGTGANNRVSLTVTATAASTTLTVTGSITSVQFEAGAFATSYIATAGTAVTRAADVATISGVSLPAGPWTLFGQVYYPIVPAVAMGIAAVDDGAAGNNLVELWVTGAARPRVQLIQGGIGTYDSGGAGFAAIVGPATVKMAASYNGSQITAQAQGVSLAASAAASPTTASNRFAFGVINGTASPTNGYIQRAVLYPQFIAGLTS